MRGTRDCHIAQFPRLLHTVQYSQTYPKRELAQTQLIVAQKVQRNSLR